MQSLRLSAGIESSPLRRLVCNATDSPPASPSRPAVWQTPAWPEGSLALQAVAATPAALSRAGADVPNNALTERLRREANAEIASLQQAVSHYAAALPVQPLGRRTERATTALQSGESRSDGTADVQVAHTQVRRSLVPRRHMSTKDLGVRQSPRSRMPGARSESIARQCEDVLLDDLLPYVAPLRCRSIDEFTQEVSAELVYFIMQVVLSVKYCIMERLVVLLGPCSPQLANLAGLIDQQLWVLQARVEGFTVTRACFLAWRISRMGKAAVSCAAELRRSKAQLLRLRAEAKVQREERDMESDMCLQHRCLVKWYHLAISQQMFRATEMHLQRTEDRHVRQSVYRHALCMGVVRQWTERYAAFLAQVILHTWAEVLLLKQLTETCEHWQGETRASAAGCNRLRLRLAEYSQCAVNAISAVRDKTCVGECFLAWKRQLNSVCMRWGLVEAATRSLNIPHYQLFLVTKVWQLSVLVARESCSQLAMARIGELHARDLQLWQAVAVGAHYRRHTDRMRARALKAWRLLCCAEAAERSAAVDAEEAQAVSCSKQEQLLQAWQRCSNSQLKYTFLCAWICSHYSNDREMAYAKQAAEERQQIRVACDAQHEQARLRWESVELRYRFFRCWVSAKLIAVFEYEQFCRHAQHENQTAQHVAILDAQTQSLHLHNRASVIAWEHSLKMCMKCRSFKVWVGALEASRRDAAENVRLIAVSLATDRLLMAWSRTQNTALKRASFRGWVRHFGVVHERWERESELEQMLLRFQEGRRDDYLAHAGQWLSLWAVRDKASLQYLYLTAWFGICQRTAWQFKQQILKAEREHAVESAMESVSSQLQIAHEERMVGHLSVFCFRGWASVVEARKSVKESDEKLAQVQDTFHQAMMAQDGQTNLASLAWLQHNAIHVKRVCLHGWLSVLDFAAQEVARKELAADIQRKERRAFNCRHDATLKAWTQSEWIVYKRWCFAAWLSLSRCSASAVQEQQRLALAEQLAEAAQSVSEAAFYGQLHEREQLHSSQAARQDRMLRAERVAWQRERDYALKQLSLVGWAEVLNAKATTEQQRQLQELQRQVAIVHEKLQVIGRKRDRMRCAASRLVTRSSSFACSAQRRCFASWAAMRAAVRDATHLAEHQQEQERRCLKLRARCAHVTYAWELEQGKVLKHQLFRIWVSIISVKAQKLQDEKLRRDVEHRLSTERHQLHQSYAAQYEQALHRWAHHQAVSMKRYCMTGWVDVLKRKARTKLEQQRLSEAQNWALHAWERGLLAVSLKRVCLKAWGSALQLRHRLPHNDVPEQLLFGILARSRRGASMLRQLLGVIDTAAEETAIAAQARAAGVAAGEAALQSAKLPLNSPAWIEARRARAELEHLQRLTRHLRKGVVPALSYIEAVHGELLAVNEVFAEAWANGWSPRSMDINTLGQGAANHIRSRMESPPSPVHWRPSAPETLVPGGPSQLRARIETSLPSAVPLRPPSPEHESIPRVRTLALTSARFTPVKTTEVAQLATVGVDMNQDGRADIYITGVDRNHDGIPDALQQAEEFTSTPSRSAKSEMAEILGNLRNFVETQREKRSRDLSRHSP